MNVENPDLARRRLARDHRSRRGRYGLWGLAAAGYRLLHKPRGSWDIRSRAELALFRSSPEGLPIQVKQALRDHSTNGLNWSLAQRVPRAPWRAWIVPGRGVVCLLHVQPQTGAIGQACTATGRLLRDGMFVASLAADPSQADGAFASSRAEPGRRVVFGVVPDRARTVRVHTPGVTPATAQVSENSFALRDETDAPPETITFIR